MNNANEPPPPPKDYSADVQRVTNDLQSITSLGSKLADLALRFADPWQARHALFSAFEIVHQIERELRASSDPADPATPTLTINPLPPIAERMLREVRERSR